MEEKNRKEGIDLHNGREEKGVDIKGKKRKQWKGETYRKEEKRKA